MQRMFDLASTVEAEQQLLRARHLVYEQDDEVGKLLAHQIRQSYASRHISKIKDLSGNFTTEQKKINATFVHYYSNLYTSECIVEYSSVFPKPRLSST